MLYIAVALVVYSYAALELLRSGAPETFREALGGALACAVVAAAWPLALIWRGLLGGSRPDPIQPAAASLGARDPSRTMGEA